MYMYVYVYIYKCIHIKIGAGRQRAQERALRRAHLLAPPPCCRPGATFQKCVGILVFRFAEFYGGGTLSEICHTH